MEVVNDNVIDYYTDAELKKHPIFTQKKHVDYDIMVQQMDEGNIVSEPGSDDDINMDEDDIPEEERNPNHKIETTPQAAGIKYIGKKPAKF